MSLSSGGCIPRALLGLVCWFCSLSSLAPLTLLFILCEPVILLYCFIPPGIGEEYTRPSSSSAATVVLATASLVVVFVDVVFLAAVLFCGGLAGVTDAAVSPSTGESPSTMWS